MVQATRTRNARGAMEEVLGAPPRGIGVPGLSINGLSESIRALSALVVTGTGFGPRYPFIRVFSLGDRT